MTPTTSPGRLLGGNRDFTLMWSGQVISALGSTTSMITYPLLVLALTKSPALAGVTMAVRMVVALVAGLPGGVIVDWVDKKRLLIGCDLARTAAQGFVAVGWLAGWLDLWMVVIAIAVEGAFSVVFGSAEPPVVRLLVHPDQLKLALARNEARGAAAMLAGPPLGGLLFGITPWLPFAVDALSYLVSAVLVALIRTPAPASVEPRRIADALPQGLRWVWAQPFTRVTLLLISGSNLVSNAIFLVAIVISNNRGDAALTTGSILTIAAVGSLAGALAAPFLLRHLSIRTILIVNRAWWTVLLPLFLLAPNAYVIGALIAAMFFMGPTGSTAVSTGQMQRTPDELQGRVASARGFCAGVAGPIGPALIGLTLSISGAGLSIAALTALMLSLTVVALFSSALKD